MEPIVSPRKAELLGSTFRRLVRRGARAHVSKLLAKTRPEDVALQLRGLMPSEQAGVFRILLADYRDSAGDVLTELEPSLRTRVFEELEPEEIADLLGEMPVDDAVAVVEDLPDDLRASVMELTEQPDLEEVQEHLTYEDDSAGRIMDSHFLALPEKTTVGEAIGAIQEGEDVDNIFYLYVVDAEGHLVGVTSLRQLLLNPPGTPLASLMSRSIIRANIDTDQEEVASLASRYDLLAIPVTDLDNKLVGIVTVDDIIDVVREEATEDFFKMVGTSDDEIVYQDHSFKVFRIRFPWLVVNLVGLAVAGLLIHWFEIQLSQALFLLPFVPVVMGMGGNIGSQTSTIAVRGLATGRITLQRGTSRQFLWQQFKVGALIGLACAALAAVGAYVMPNLPLLDLEGDVALLPYAAVVGVSLFLAIVVASVNGAFIPLVFERLGIDPAVAAGPLVTTSNDITGIIIYFGLASLLISYLVP
ncbi:MAG: magnesium transporter [bacterium]|nr:magnesium transporter [bacterium]